MQTTKQLLKLLRYLVEKGSGQEEAKERVVNQLLADGWTHDPALPPGWLQRHKARGGKEALKYLLDEATHYLSYSPAFGKYNTKSAAVMALKRQGMSKACLARFTANATGAVHSIGGNGGKGWRFGTGLLPAGWKVNDSKVLSPEGLIYPDRVAALRHLSMELCREVYSRAEVEQIRCSLVKEGWMEHTMLPEGWRVRRTSKLSSFLTRDATVLEDYSHAVRYLTDPKNRINSSDVRNFREAESSLKENQELQVMPDCSEDDGDSPQGWTRERLSEGLVQICSPTGSTFFSRIKAMEAMLEEEVDPDSVAVLWEELGEEGWIFGLPHLPLGWGARMEGPLQFIFLTRELEVLVSSEEALLYIETDESYSGEDYKKLDCWVDTLRAASWAEEEELPLGWKSWSLEEEEDEDSLFLEEATGAILRGRVGLLRFLIQSGGQEGGSMLKLWETLDREGWMTEESGNLPPGWKSKYDLDTSRYLYLSPMMEVVDAPIEMLERGKDDSLGEEERIVCDQLKMWLSQKKVSSAAQA